MEGFEILGISIIFFVVYLYLPAATYRFAVETRVDLRRPTDLSELEAFISAAIPSVVINGVTFVLLRFIAKCPILRRSAAVLYVDWGLLSSFVTGVHRREAFDAIVSGARGTLLYALSLLMVSFALGLMYAESVRTRLTRTTYPQLRDQVIRALALLIPAAWRPLVFQSLMTNPARTEELYQLFTEIERHLRGDFQGPLLPNRKARRSLRLFFRAILDIGDGLNWHFGNSFLHESVEWMFRWSLSKPPVFVRAKGDRLFHGVFERYTKSHEGEIATISLTSVERYCAAEAEEILRDGRLPFEPFSGTLTLMWDEIADIHEASKKHLLELHARFVYSRKLVLAKSLLAHFDGEDVTLAEICGRVLGGDYFKVSDVEDALSHLVEVGAVSLPIVDPLDATRPQRYGFTSRRAGVGEQQQAASTPHDGRRFDDVPTRYPARADLLALDGRMVDRRKRRDRIRLNERRRNGGGNGDGFVKGHGDSPGGNGSDTAIVQPDRKPPV
jgi:hypothetical protein